MLPSVPRLDELRVFLSRDLRVDLLPGLVRIEPSHVRHEPQRVVAEIFLVDRAGMIDQDGHDTRSAVLGGIGDQREPTDHLACDDIVECAARCVRALLLQNPVIIAMIRRRTRADLVSFGRGPRGQFAKRALASIRRRPVETVLLPGSADDALGIDTSTLSGPVLLGIFVLRVDIGKTSLDRVQFVAPDAPIQDFEAAGRGIKLPASLLPHQRNRKWKIIGTEDDHGLLVTLEPDRMLGIAGASKPLACLGVSDIVAGRNDIRTPKAKHFEDIPWCSGFNGDGKCAGGWLWG